MNYLVLKIAGILERVNPFIADDIVKILPKREKSGSQDYPGRPGSAKMASLQKSAVARAVELKFSSCRGEKSGRQDSNLRLLGPKPSALPS